MACRRATSDRRGGARGPPLLGSVPRRPALGREPRRARLSRPAARDRRARRPPRRRGAAARARVVRRLARPRRHRDAVSSIAVSREGDGPEVLLVHGGASAVPTWSGLEPLAARFTLAYAHRRGYAPSPEPIGGRQD